VEQSGLHCAECGAECLLREDTCELVCPKCDKHYYCAKHNGEFYGSTCPFCINEGG
jgi:hypothetical protein